MITRTALNRHDIMSVEHLFSLKVCIHIFHADVKVKIAKNTNLNSFKEPSRLKAVVTRCCGFITFVVTLPV